MVKSALSVAPVPAIKLYVKVLFPSGSVLLKLPITVAIGLFSATLILLKQQFSF